MKKCLLISYFYSQNFGDIAIANTFYNNLSKYYEVIKMHIAGNYKIKKRQDSAGKKARIIDFIRKIGLGFIYNLYVRSKIKKRINKELSQIDFDFVIFGGGNLLFETSKASNYLTNIKSYCDYLIKNNKKYVFSLIGAGPFFSKKQLRLANSLVQSSFYTSYRDVESLDLINKYKKLDNVYSSVDPVLTYKCEPSFGKERDYILLNFIDVNLCSFSFSERLIIERIIAFIKELRKKTDKKLILFSSDKADISFLTRIAKILNSQGVNCSLIPIGSLDELVSLINGASFVFASRMHSLIFSFVLRKQFIGFSWSEKVTSFMKDNGLINRMVKYPDFFFEDIEKGFTSFFKYDKNVYDRIERKYGEELKRLAFFQKDEQ